MTSTDESAGDADAVRAGFEELPMPVALLSGPPFRFIAVNAAYRAFAGRDQLVGQTVRETFPEVAQQQIFEMIERVYRTGKPVTAKEWRIQFDRGRGTEDRYLDFTVSPRRAADGSVVGLIVQQTDVTEHVREREATEAAAAEAQERYLAARDVVMELQQALLPTELPMLPQVQVAARYLVAATDQAAGGDWFDAIPLPGGTLALVVGDVVGHGITASAAMGQLRAVLKQQLLANVDLLDALVQVDAYAATDTNTRAATLAVVVLEPASGRVRYSLCGHPPPLVLREDGRAEFLPRTMTGPLGVGSKPVVADAMLGAGELVLLYSDGLVERPQRTLGEANSELTTVAADAAANRVLPQGAAVTPVDRVCQLTVELLTRTGYSDDVTTLAAQRLSVPFAPLVVEVTAGLDGHLFALDRFRAWLNDLHPSDIDRHALLTSVGEALANVTDHAYPVGAAGPLRLTAELGPDGVCECRISDQGRWRAPSQADEQSWRGLGLLMCERLVDELTITHSPQRTGEPVGARGTTVTLRHRMHHPAALAATPGVAVVSDRGGVPFRTELVPGPDACADSDPDSEVDLPSDSDAFSDQDVFRDANPRLAAENHVQPQSTTGPDVRVRAVANPEGRTVRVSGALDITTAEQFARDLSAASRGGVLPLTVDLSAVTHLASAGVRVLYETTEQLAAHRHRPKFVTSPGSPAAMVLDLVHLPYTAR